MLFYVLQLQWMKHLTHLLTATFTFEGDGMMAKRFQIIAVKRLGSLLVMEISVGEYLCFCTECKCSAPLCWSMWIFLHYFKVLLVSGRCGDELWGTWSGHRIKTPEHHLAKASLPKSTLVSVWTSTEKSYLNNFIGLHIGHSAETLAYKFCGWYKSWLSSFDKLQGPVLYLKFFLRLWFVISV